MTSLDEKAAGRILEFALKRFGSQHPVVRKVFVEETLEVLRAVHDAAIEHAALVCKAREVDEEFKAHKSKFHMREQAIVMADCACELTKEIRALKIGESK